MRQLFAALIAILSLTHMVRAQDYPTRPVKILIAFPVGGLLDTVSRIVGEKLGAQLGQSFIVEARSGAGGTIATGAVANADPDGYTLMMINDNHALNPSVFKKLPYDSIKDFAPIGFVGYTPLILIASPALPVKDVKGFVELAKQKPGALTYASVGAGSASHLAGVMTSSASDIRLLHVPYRGGAPAINDLLAGHVNTMFLSPVTTLSHLQAGKLTALGIAAKSRLEILPDIPTMAEAGVPVEASYWFGLVAPAATPPAVIAKLEKTLLEVLAMPDVRKRLADLGVVLTPLKSKEFGDYIKAEIVKWADVVGKAGVTPE